MCNRSSVSKAVGNPYDVGKAFGKVQSDMTALGPCGNRSGAPALLRSWDHESEITGMTGTNRLCLETLTSR